MKFRHLLLFGAALGFASLCLGQIPGNKLEQDAATMGVQTSAGPVPPSAIVAYGLIDRFGNLVANGASGTLALTASTTIGGSSVVALGTITSTSANAFAVGRAGTTNPAFNVDASTASSATGINIKAAAAAGGVAVKVLSSGTNESVTIDAKGSGTITLNSIATGNVIIGSGTGAAVITKARVTQENTVYTSDGAIALTSGIAFVEKTSAAAMTVAAPSSQDGARITIIGNTDFAHVITFTGGTLLDGTTGANTTATMAAFKGASITVVARGTKWLVESLNQCTCAP